MAESGAMAETDAARPLGVRSERELERLCAETRVPKWAHVLIDTYFVNWPFAETQAAYRAAGKRATQYMYWEPYRIFCARLAYDAQFRALPHVAEYLMRKYPGDGVRVRDMDRADRTSVLAAFTTQLGMHLAIFSYGVDDFPGPAAPTPSAASTTSRGGGGSVTHDVWQ